MSNIRATVNFEVTKDISGELRKATEDAFAQIAGELTARFDAAISGEHWPWPDSTPRFGGTRDLDSAADNWNTYLTGAPGGARPKAIAGSPRSIVDSGNLKQSRDFDLDRASLKAEWTWNADYAAAVHEGAYINPFGNKNKIVQLPARPWTKAVIEGGTVASGIPVYPVAANLKKYITQRTG